MTVEEEERTRSLMRQIWSLALQLPEARGRPSLAAWGLFSMGGEALLSTEQADARFLSDTVYLLDRDAQRRPR